MMIPSDNFQAIIESDLRPSATLFIQCLCQATALASFFIMHPYIVKICTAVLDGPLVVGKFFC